MTDAGECTCKVTRNLRLRVGLYEVIEASKEFCCTSFFVQLVHSVEECCEQIGGCLFSRNCTRLSVL